MAVSSSSRPPFGMASRALTARLRMASSSRDGSALVRHRSGASAVSMRICSPSVCRSIATMRGTISLRSRTRASQRLLARERQHALGELDAPLRRLVDGLAYLGELGLPGDGARQHLVHADDDGEDVVEVVGDAAGQLADRLHLLGLAQLLLELDALGHVAADEEVLLLGLRPYADPGERHDAGRPCERSGNRNCAWMRPRRASRISLRVFSRSSG